MYCLRDTSFGSYGGMIFSNLSVDETVVRAIYDLYTKDLFDNLDEEKIIIRQHRFWYINCPKTFEPGAINNGVLYTEPKTYFFITEISYDFGLKINHSYLSSYSVYNSSDLFFIKNFDFSNKEPFSLSDILTEDICSLGDFGVFIIKNIDKFNGERWTLFNSLYGDQPAIGIRRK